MPKSGIRSTKARPILANKTGLDLVVRLWVHLEIVLRNPTPFVFPYLRHSFDFSFWRPWKQYKYCGRRTRSLTRSSFISSKTTNLLTLHCNLYFDLHNNAVPYPCRFCRSMLYVFFSLYFLPTTIDILPPLVSLAVSASPVPLPVAEAIAAPVRLCS
jgi:hypothetical protein